MKNSDTAVEEFMISSGGGLAPRSPPKFLIFFFKINF